MKKKLLTVLGIIVFLFLTLVLWNRGFGFGESYQLINVIGKKGSGPGQFNEPFDIAVDRNGFLYVTDARNLRVQKLDRDGKFILEWGGQGEGGHPLK